MKEAEFCYIKREWLAKAVGLKNPQLCGLLIDAIHAYAFNAPIPKLPDNVREYYELTICPEIDAQRAEWRQYDRRKAQFDDIVAELPTKMRQRYEMEFLTNAYNDEADFLAYLDELREDLNNLNTRNNERNNKQ